MSPPTAPGTWPTPGPNSAKAARHASSVVVAAATEPPAGSGSVPAVAGAEPGPVPGRPRTALPRTAGRFGPVPFGRMVAFLAVPRVHYECPLGIDGLRVKAQALVSLAATPLGIAGDERWPEIAGVQTHASAPNRTVSAVTGAVIPERSLGAQPAGRGRSRRLFWLRFNWMEPAGPGRRHMSVGVRIRAVSVMFAVAATGWMPACGGGAAKQAATSPTVATGGQAPCPTGDPVRAVAAAGEHLRAGWLPDGFRLTSGQEENPTLIIMEAPWCDGGPGVYCVD